jgi:hypothetical protein
MNKKDAYEALEGVNCLASNPDLIEIEIEDGFFYKIGKGRDDRPTVDTGWGKNPEDGWIPLHKAKGQYCGYNSITENDFHLKIRIREPFCMANFHGNYDVFCVSNLLSIKKVD